ncbi:MAG: tetratricopeptide repeat protein [Armatimonadetes bacterium]|nr:tetratricopeptide repeat protein [Armatimonadota bacterium]
MMKYVLLGLGFLVPLGCQAADTAAFKGFTEAMAAGEAAMEARHLPQAREAFEAAGRLAGKDEERASARLSMGHTLYHDGRYAEARAVYTEVLAMPGAAADDLFYARQFTGHSFVQEEDFAGALQAYRDTYEKGRARPTLYGNVRNDIIFAYMDAVSLGQRLYRLGETARAEAALKGALALEGLPAREQSLAWLTLGHCRFHENDFTGARAAYEKVLDLEALCPDGWDRSEAQLSIARSFEKEGRSEDARQARARLLTLAGAHPNHRAEAVDRLKAMGADIRAPIQGLDAEYGAECNPTGSPIGGGQGYARIVTRGDQEVATLAELEAALQRLAGMAPEARRGKVVYLKPGAKINLAGRTGFVVPSGVTLAGNRGQAGAPGPLLYSDAHFEGYAALSLEADARLTGIRFQGDAAPFKELFGIWPHGYFSADFFEKSGRKKPSATAVRCGDRVEVDNCELSCFQTAISVSGYDIHVHHNYLHDIHAYPVVFNRGGARDPLIEANIIDWAWHAVATADDMMASLIVRYNLFREVAPNLWGQGVSGQFAVDHHGMGVRFDIHHNTFLHLDRQEGVPNRSICLAPPWDIARMRNNWFVDYMTADEATYWSMQQPVKTMVDLKAIVTRRDLSAHMKEYLENIQDYSQFDVRQIVAMTRAGVGGQNMWVYNNAYGTERDVLDTTIFTTPHIFFVSPTHRRVRTRLGQGRGGTTNPPLHHLRGEVPIDMQVEVLRPLTLKRVTIDLLTVPDDRLYSGRYIIPQGDEARRLYEGTDAPAPGAVALDTRRLPNGVYGLLVTAEDSRGIRADHQTYFEVVNPAGR